MKCLQLKPSRVLTYSVKEYYLETEREGERERGERGVCVFMCVHQIRNLLRVIISITV